jgi:hypothetical protein
MDFLVYADEGDIYLIECNPRAHTTLVNFGEKEERMIEGYLSVFSERKTEENRKIVVPQQRLDITGFDMTSSLDSFCRY